jgi:hypothetical protein
LFFEPSIESGSTVERGRSGDVDRAHDACFISWHADGRRARSPARSQRPLQSFAPVADMLPLRSAHPSGRGPHPLDGMWRGAVRASISR